MSLVYGPPGNLTVNEALHAVFTNYCSDWKSALTKGNNSDHSEDNEDSISPSMDSANFLRLIRESPGLARNIGRTEVDLIYSKVKPIKARRLYYENFLDAILELAIRIYPDADPTTALANFIARFVFALFDQPAANTNVVERIYFELSSSQQ